MNVRSADLAVRQPSEARPTTFAYVGVSDPRLPGGRGRGARARPPMRARRLC
jgi:hypothetical protein